jgi:FkbM family methyltransferase
VIRRLKRILQRKAIFFRSGFRPDLSVSKNLPPGAIEYFGTGYGGWPVITSLLTAESTVLSFGLGEDISFDLDLIERFELSVHGFDPTPKSCQWLADQSLPDRFYFHNIGLAAETGTLTFNAPVEEGFASWSATHSIGDAGAKAVSLPVKSYGAIYDDLGLDTVDVLKMDIEGSENEVVEFLGRSDYRPIQILVEFHHRIHGTDFSRTKAAIETLESMGYRLFHISDLGDEFSLVLEKALGQF